MNFRKSYLWILTIALTANLFTYSHNVSTVTKQQTTEWVVSNDLEINSSSEEITFETLKAINFLVLKTVNVNHILSFHTKVYSLKIETQNKLISNCGNCHFICSLKLIHPANTDKDKDRFIG